MKNLKELSIEELQSNILEAQNEIASREAAGKGFYKEFSKNSKKAYSPCTYKQVQFAESLASKTNSSIDTSTSQLIKYFEMEKMCEAIDLMKQDKRIRIS